MEQRLLVHLCTLTELENYRTASDDEQTGSSLFSNTRMEVSQQKTHSGVTYATRDTGGHTLRVRPSGKLKHSSILTLTKLSDTKLCRLRA